MKKKSKKHAQNFKSLSEINSYILTKEYGKDEADRIMREMKKFEKMGQPSKNKVPI